MKLKKEFPPTVQAAVDILLKTVPPKEQLKIPRMCHEGLFMLQFSVGALIRRNMGLCEGNDQLVHDTGETDIDLVCMVIIRALWTHLCINGVVG